MRHLWSVLYFLWPAFSLVHAGTERVDCNAGGSIGAALTRLKPGDTLAVTGFCRESVTVPAHIVGITLDGQGKATIQHPGVGRGPLSQRHVLYVRAQGLTISGFTIRGGEDGVHLSGPAQAVIDSNLIVENRGRGVHLDKGSVAQIVNNVIQSNGRAGIHIAEHSYARIGFLIPPDGKRSPNKIQSNGSHGVHIERLSSAWVVANAITQNNGNGVYVDRNSQADVVGNTIDGNSGDAVAVARQSGVVLSSAGTPRAEGPNMTQLDAKNGGVAIRCSMNSYVDGVLGSLLGAQGARAFDRTCVSNLDTRE